MQVSFSSGKWVLQREETSLDDFVKEFVGVLDNAKVKYVLVSGYVAILFGRSRNSEDVDFFIEETGKEKFHELWAALAKKFECINTDEEQDALENYLNNQTAIRFSRKEKPLPNAEVKFASEDMHYWTLNNAQTAELNGFSFKISPMELQIPYKLFLGSDKDLEDAEHLWLVTKDFLDKKKLNSFTEKLNVGKKAEKWLQ